MIIVCYGMPRSASTYIWQTAFELINNRYHQYNKKEQLPEEVKADFIYYSHKAIPILLEHLPDDIIYLVKTHGDFHPDLRKYEDQEQIKVICCYRNPYDLIQSWTDVVKKEQQKPLHERREGFAEVECYEDVLDRVLRDVKICRDWLTGLQNPLEFPYRISIRSVVDNIKRLAQFINMDDYDLEIIKSFQSSDGQILEFNKGILGRGTSPDAMIYPRHAKVFKDFIDDFNL